jgi:hypothetical protein
VAYREFAAELEQKLAAQTEAVAAAKREHQAAIARIAQPFMPGEHATLSDELCRLRAEVAWWKEHELEWFQVIESIHNFHPVSQTEALQGGIARVKRLKAKLASLEEVANWAQCTLTGLNVGDVASGPKLHLKLREVLIAHRARLAELA